MLPVVSVHMIQLDGKLCSTDAFPRNTVYKSSFASFNALRCDSKYTFQNLVRVRDKQGKIMTTTLRYIFLVSLSLDFIA